MSEILDRTVLVALSDSVGAEFVAELIDTFIEEAALMFGELRQALPKNDADSFRRAAHSLKTNASTFGATQLAKLARELEAGARAGSLPTTDGVDMLETSFREAAAELDLYKQAMVTKGSIS